MFLKNKHTHASEKAVILPASLSDLKAAHRSGRFVFDWVAEHEKQIYKLQLEESKKVIGFMAIIDFPREIRIDIHALEVSKENVGAQKIYEGVAGCLIAFACRMAFLNGYGGFVSLTPKTALTEHYIAIYGFSIMGRKLVTFDENSKLLIQTYLEARI